MCYRAASPFRFLCACKVRYLNGVGMWLFNLN
jgi:hypothetical protein